MGGPTERLEAGGLAFDFGVEQRDLAFVAFFLLLEGFFGLFEALLGDSVRFFLFEELCIQLVDLAAEERDLLRDRRAIHVGTHAVCHGVVLVDLFVLDVRECIQSRRASRFGAADGRSLRGWRIGRRATRLAISTRRLC